MHINQISELISNNAGLKIVGGNLHFLFWKNFFRKFTLQDKFCSNFKCFLNLVQSKIRSIFLLRNSTNYSIEYMSSLFYPIMLNCFIYFLRIHICPPWLYFHCIKVLLLLHKKWCITDFSWVYVWKQISWANILIYKNVH